MCQFILTFVCFCDNIILRFFSSNSLDNCFRTCVRWRLFQIHQGRRITMATHVVTGDQYRVIDRRMGEIKRQLNQDGGSPLDPEFIARVLQTLIEQREVIIESDTVVVPNISATTLIARARRDLALTYLDEDLAKWDFVNSEGGRRYKPLVWTPGCTVQSADIRAYFRERGFNGNSAAFI